MKHSDTKILVVQDLSKIFTERSAITGSIKKQFTALDRVSFSLNEGEILGILGPNGAGKTTLMQILLQVMTPTSGNILYFNKNINADRRGILEKIAFASTYVQLPGNLTVYENLSIYAQLYGITGTTQQERIKKFLTQFGMWQSRDKLCKYLSAGQITRTILAKAFMTHPKLVLLDEPTASLDPDIAIDVRNFIINQQHEFKVSILFTSHNMPEVAEVCDRILVLKRGRIIADSTPEELAASIAEVRMDLIIDTPIEAVEQLFKERHLIYSVNKNKISVELQEQEIPQVLQEISRRSISFTQISIEKPTLEDYFLHISRMENGNGHE